LTGTASLPTADRRVQGVLARLGHLKALLQGALFDARRALRSEEVRNAFSQLQTENLTIVQDFVEKRLRATALMIASNSVSNQSRLAGVRGAFEEEVYLTRTVAGHEWAEIPVVRQAFARFRPGMAQLVFHRVDVGLIDRMCKQLDSKREKPKLPAECEPSSDRASSLVYYISGWFLKHIRKRIESARSGAQWFWPLWHLANRLDESSNAVEVAALPTEVTAERQLGRLTFASSALFRLFWRIEHIYVTLLASEELAFHRGDILDAVLRRVQGDDVTPRLFAATIPASLAKAVEERGASATRELLDYVLKVYNRLRGGDFTRKLMSHLHSVVAASTQRGTGTLCTTLAASSVAAKGKARATSAPAPVSALQLPAVAPGAPATLDEVPSGPRRHVTDAEWDEALLEAEREWAEDEMCEALVI
jgi:hypothetical protein